MILIEEDDERVGEESCSEPHEETAHKENKNTNNNKPHIKPDTLSKPRAL